MRQNEMLMKKINEDAQRDQETKAQNAFLKQKQKVNEEPLQFKPRRQEQLFSYKIDSSS